MGERVLDPRLKELYDQKIPVYSISKLDTINNCLHCAYLTYIMKNKNKKQNVYSSLGTRVHDTLEAIVNNNASEEDLLQAIHSELEDLDLLGVSFPKDRTGGDSIKNGWITNMEHFATTYKSPKGSNLLTEQFFLYTSPNNNKLQGYIDLIKINKDGSIDIYDYKTSTKYSAEEFAEHGRQLLLYAMAKMQEGYNVRKVAWIFLKYVEVRFEGYKTKNSKNKSSISKVIERKKIGTEMEKYVRRDLSDNGYDDLDIDLIIEDFKSTNKFDSLPEQISGIYKMLPYVCDYALDDDSIKECEEYIDTTIAKWESLGGADAPDDYPARSFYKFKKNGDAIKDTFFCGALCDNSLACVFFKDFKDQNRSNDDEDFY